MACLKYLRAFSMPIQTASSQDESRLEEFIDDGEGFAIQLEGVVHGELEAQAVDRSALNAWLRYCQEIERTTAVALIRAQKS